VRGDDGQDGGGVNHGTFMPRQLTSCPWTSAVSHPEVGLTVPVTDSSVLPPTSCAVISKVPARRLRVPVARASDCRLFQAMNPVRVSPASATIYQSTPGHPLLGPENVEPSCWKPERLLCSRDTSGGRKRQQTRRDQPHHFRVSRAAATVMAHTLDDVAGSACRACAAVAWSPRASGPSRTDRR
jgi:hypothetical protein